MAMTKEQKDALSEFFRGKDAYDPSTAPEQEVSTFTPKALRDGGSLAMSKGGMVADTDFDSISGLMKKSPTHKGMADGVIHLYEGGVPQADASTFSEESPLQQLVAAANNHAPDSASDIRGALAPKMFGGVPPSPATLPPKETQGAQMAAPPDPFSVSSSTDTDRSGGLNVPPQSAAPQIASAPAAPMPKTPALDAWGLSGIDPTAGPAASTPAAQAGASKLSPDQRDELSQYLAALSKGPSAGQRAARALGALGDGIMQGVARAGNPGFAKNISENENSQRQQMLEALRAKFDKQFRSQELDINQQRANDENTRAAAAIAAENARSAGERKTQERGQDLEAAANRGRIAYETQNAALERAQAAQNAQQSAAKDITDASQKAGTIRTFLANLGFGNAPTSDQAQAAISKLAGANSAVRSASRGAQGPYGQTTTRNGKNYEWSPISGKYHPVGTAQ
jgi:hypothetical protein